MTNNNHPITPPPELVQQWCYEDGDEIRTSPRWYQRVCAKAAQWGYEQRGASNEAELQKARDEELEACCAEMREHWGDIHNAYGWELSQNLRAARRPRPPSLKAQALALLDPSNTYGSITQEEEYRISVANADTIRRALEALPND